MRQPNKNHRQEQKNVNINNSSIISKYTNSNNIFVRTQEWKKKAAMKLGEKYLKHEDKEVEACTFHPNTKKKLPAEIKLPESTFLQRVSRWNEAKNESIKKKQEEKAAKHDDGCTFTPQVNQSTNPRTFNGKSFYEKNIRWACDTSKDTQLKFNRCSQNPKTPKPHK